MRELFLAARVGATADLDAVLIALVLPTTLAGVVTSGIVRALVPAYLEAAELAGHDAARRLSGALIIWMGLAGLALSVTLALFAGGFVAIAGPGLSVASSESAAHYLQILAPVSFVTTLSAIFTAIAQAEGRFAAISFAGLGGTTVVLGTMLLFWSSLGLKGLVFGTVLGSVMTFAILLSAATRGRFLPIPGIQLDARIIGLLRHAAPLTVSAAILQINVIGDRAIASLIGPGAVSLLRYADVLVRVPIGAIGPAWGSAIYPTLVRTTLGRAAGGLAATTERAMRYVIAIFTPLAVLTMAVAPLAVAIAYGRGAFDAHDVSTTAVAVAAFAPLLLVVMLVPVLTGAHNARRRGTLLLVGGTLNVAVNISLDVLLGTVFGVAGIALASSVAESTVLLLFTYRLSRSRDPFALRPLARQLVLALQASAPIPLVLAAFTWSGHVPSDTLPAIVTLVGMGLLGAIGYLLIATKLGLEEPRAVARALTAPVLGRLRPVGRP
jgi:putative peptidoglycan lipid II flippase